MAIRPKMDREQRAKQFMPFAALKGYEEALQKKERIIVEKKEITDDYAEELDRKIMSLSPLTMITVIYYENQQYLKFTGMLVKVNTTEKYIQIVDKKIFIDDIYNIEKAN